MIQMIAASEPFKCFNESNGLLTLLSRLSTQHSLNARFRRGVSHRVSNGSNRSMPARSIARLRSRTSLSSEQADIKETFAKLRAFVWARLNYPVTQDGDRFPSSSSGSLIDWCLDEGEYSLGKIARYVGAMFDAVQRLRRFILYRRAACNVWQPA